VLEANTPYAYQPLYFLIQNSLMRVTRWHSLNFFRSVNLVILGLCLWGLLKLSQNWRLPPRLFLLGVFSFNAFLFMHVLQIREYIAGVAFYIWSTWIVLALDRRNLDRPVADAAWFVGYGGLLTAGFYLQSWVVLPAIGQGLFLVLRRRATWWRFVSLLALGYAIVLAATVPYLVTHQQKINVGLWARETEPVESHLFNGFHLVLSGHLPNIARFSNFLFWFWLATIAGGAFLYLWDKTSAPAQETAVISRRQGLLMILCITTSLIFQIYYALKIENLAVWPRYFVIHYFFVVWLIALSFRYLWELSVAGGSRWAQRSLVLVAGTLGVVLASSAVFQTRSFYRNPFLDTGLNRISNWSNLGAGLSRILRPGDAVVMPDFITRSTLAATWPLPHSILLLSELKSHPGAATARVVFVEPVWQRNQRDNLIQQMQARGYSFRADETLQTPDGTSPVPDWRLLIFDRS